MLTTVAKTAWEHALTGMEFAAGIPGTVGGAVVMNAGAYDGEMKQVVQTVTVLSEAGEIMEISNNSMQFSYRSSIIKQHTCKSSYSLP